MRISGFSFVRNGVRFDYPFIESISSLLPLCDEVVVAVGASDDDTLDRLQRLSSPKLRLIETVWDDSLRTGGTVLADQTNIALSHVNGDWAFYLQADEVIHEEDHQRILDSVRLYHDDQEVEGLLFSYKHFYGSYQYVGDSRRWYRREIRLVRNQPGIRSWGDAQGFRINERKLRVKLIDASIYHYGWVKPPRQQQEKQKTFNKLWHSDEWVERHVGDAEEYDYSRGGRLHEFRGTHPAVMRDRIARQDWRFTYEPSKVTQPLKERFLDWIEKGTGIRIGEYKNYRMV